MPGLLDYKALSADYGGYHVTRGNRLCHIVGIPLIMLAVVRWTQVGSAVPWAALVLVLYFAWAPRLALAMALVLAGMAGLSSHLPVWAAPAAFVLGWIFQFIGHGVYEKRSPAFAQNLIHVLVGPLWVLEEILSCKS